MHDVEQYLDVILKNTTEAIFVIQADGVIQRTNRAFTEMFGYSTEEAYKRSILDLVVRDDRPRLGETLGIVMDGQAVERINLTARRRDGATFYVSITVSAVNGRYHMKQDIVCSAYDISARQQTEQLLREALQKERMLIDMKHDFTAMVSHDIRTPLAIIQTSVEVIKALTKKNHGANALELKQIARIEAAVLTMIQLLEEVLSLSALEAASRELHLAPLNLEAFCRNLIEEIQSVSGSAHTLLYSYAGQCEDTFVDRVLIQQILTNLLSNAIKYSPEGSPVSLETLCEESRMIFNVRDKGIGIPEGDKPHLFEPFHRAKNVGSQKGSGLGLAIVKKAVELHRGKIEFESQPGTGTTFTVTLPR
jgi:PAS domain S-box-containing protein